MEQEMQLTRIVLVVLALAFPAQVPALADYEAGQKAWNTGRPDQAVTQWKAAANAGDGRAMRALGRLFVQGLGVSQDYIEAHKWFNLAASRGEAAALEERNAVAAKMTPAQIAMAQERAAAWQSGADRDGGAPDGTNAKAAQAVPAPASAPDAVPPPPRAIREAQALMDVLGYRPGPADGIWGRHTAEAYRAFLRDAGLPAAETLTPGSLRSMREIARRGGIVQGTARTAAAEAVKRTSKTPISGGGIVRPDTLHRAARSGDVVGLKKALGANGDVNARDGQGWTALMHAVNKGYTLLVPLLLEAKADVDIRAHDGATALFMASLRGHAEIFAQLMKAGANMLIPGPRGRTPLEVAQIRDDSKLLMLPEVVAYLEKKKEHQQREEAQQLAEADAKAFSRAQSLNSLQAYKAYLSSWCPEGNSCLIARTQLDDMVRERISGKTFSGPLQNPYYNRLTVEFHSLKKFNTHYHHKWFGGASHSGTWRVENGQVQLHIPDGIIDPGATGFAELDDSVLQGHLDYTNGYVETWRLTEDPKRDLKAKQLLGHDSHSSNEP